MSQSRKFKVPAQAEHPLPSSNNVPSCRLSKARTATDLQARTAHPSECRRNKSKKRVPKSLRYDLESALVGLCDEWFEKIKPHLVRNNIKLHVHNTAAGADTASARGDFEPPTTTCEHVDPGAALDRPRRKDAFYVASCATQPTASAARCFKPPVSILRQKQFPRGRTQKFHQNSETPILFKNKYKSQPRKVFRKRRSSANKPAPAAEATMSIKDLHIRNLFKSIFNKAPICPPASPTIELKNPSKSKHQIMSVASQTVDPNAYMDYSLPDVYSISRPRAAISQHKTPQKPLQTPPVLFQHDLIQIIGKKNDKILRDIRESQGKVGYPSVVHLVSPTDGRKATEPKKNRPWR